MSPLDTEKTENSAMGFVEGLHLEVEESPGTIAGENKGHHKTV
jgi:hypothetical protein